MVKLFSTYWWTFAVRGFVSLLFGLFVLSWPGLSLDLLVVTFGLFALLQGILSLMPGLSKLAERIYFLLLEGVVGIMAGIFTFMGPGIGSMLWPEIATVTLIFFIVFWSVLIGMGEVIGSLRLPNEIKQKWVLTVSGLVGVLFAIILFSRSELGTVKNASLIGSFSIAFGILWLFFGLKTHGLSSRR